MEMHTDRLSLRRWDPDDDADVRIAFDIYRRMAVVEWLSRPPQPLEAEGEASARLRRWARFAGDRPGFGMWAVVPEDVGVPVGTVLLLPLPVDGVLTDDVEIGWHVHPDHWGNGYATEAARAVLTHAFDDLGLPVVNAIAHAGNTASFAVMRRLGMTYRGTNDRWYGSSFEWWTSERLNRSRTARFRSQSGRGPGPDDRPRIGHASGGAS